MSLLTIESTTEDHVAQSVADRRSHRLRPGGGFRSRARCLYRSASASNGSERRPAAVLPKRVLGARVPNRGGPFKVIDARPATGSSVAGTVYVVAASSRVTRQVPLDSDMAVAAIRGRYGYLYNDKIGYVIDARTGRSAPSWVEFDNYRGLYDGDGQRRVQTQATITLVGPSLGIMRNTLSFTGIVEGCAIGRVS